MYNRTVSLPDKRREGRAIHDCRGDAMSRTIVDTRRFNRETDVLVIFEDPRVYHGMKAIARSSRIALFQTTRCGEKVLAEVA